MPTETADKAQGTLFARNFQDAVTFMEFDGKLVVVAREFGAFLSYAEEGRKLVDLIMNDWSDEFVDDVDLVLLKNGRLAEFKRICAELGLKLVDKRAPSLLLLTATGIQLVLARTEKPEGKVFRRWLVSEVIPAWQATKALPGPLPPAAPPSALPAIAPASSLDELRYRVDGLQRLALDGQAAGLLDRATMTALLTQAGALLVAGAGGRGDGGGPQLPAIAMSGGEADAENPGLVPLAWATRFDALIARNQRPVPGLPREFEGKTPQDLWIMLGDVHHFLSDRAWRFLTRWMVEAGVVHYGRWMDLLNAAGKDKRAAEAATPPRRRRDPAVVPS